MSLDLVRALTVAGDGALFKTIVELHEVATDDDSGPAIYLSQYDDSQDDPDQPSDSVHLTWAMWNEVRDFVESYQDVMPERSDTIKADPDEQVLYRSCGARPDPASTIEGPCVLTHQHALMVGGSGFHVDRLGQRWTAE